MPIQEHETHWTRALVTQARTNLAGAARLHTVVFDKGFLDGTDLWWLDQQEILFWFLPKRTWPSPPMLGCKRLLAKV